MTKQHFIRAAEIVYANGHSMTARAQAEGFITLFQEYNPRFDEQRFLVACGLVEKAPKVKR